MPGGSFMILDLKLPVTAMSRDALAIRKWCWKMDRSDCG